MKITSISCWQVPLTSHTSYYMAEGKACVTVTSTIVRIDSDEGVSGWGEVCPIPHYLPAYAHGVIPAIEEMLPVLLGADPRGPVAINDRMHDHLPGHLYAKSAIDIALWDLFGKAIEQPLYRVLGGLHNQDLPLYHSITCVEPEAMADMARDAYASGIRQFQAKLGADNDWKKDAERLIAVREAVGDGPLVYGDWNCGATRLHATRTGRAVRDYDVMLEQPCARLDDCAAVRVASGLAMKIDENGHDMESLLYAHQLGCMDAVALKLSKFGGLTELRRARDLCYHLGAQMCVEDTWGSDICMAAAMHLAAASRPESVLNVCDLSGYVYPRLAPDGPSRQDGRIRVSDGIGLGIEVDEAILGEKLAHFEART